MAHIYPLKGHSIYINMEFTRSVVRKKTCTEINTNDFMIDKNGKFWNIVVRRIAELYKS